MTSEEACLEEHQKELAEDPLVNFLPHWTSIMERYYLENNDEMIVEYHNLDRYGGNWFQQGCCFVGEAHGFSDSWINNNCKTCYDLSMSHKPQFGIRSFYAFKETLYNHMRSKHSQ